MNARPNPDFYCFLQQASSRTIWLRPYSCNLERRRFEEQFADIAGRTYIGKQAPFYFESIGQCFHGAEGVKLFLLKQTYKSFLFLSETMDIFCRAGKPSSQPIWRSADTALEPYLTLPTHLAEGLTHCNFLTFNDQPRINQPNGP